MAVWLAALLLLAPADRLAIVNEGVLRWADSGDEVALFGVNYYPPFSIDYRQLKAAGHDLQQVMDQDLDHLARLGLDCLRLHCWDRELSDADGNLLDNEHLALLDYLIDAAARRGLYTVLTPICWWGTPNPSAGFANHYSKEQLAGDPGRPREAQRRFLAQFVQHRNRYRQQTYAADPAVLAFELFNEPAYDREQSTASRTEWIESLLAAVRETGCAKPLYFSYFHGATEAVGASTADGITFGWYPTGLVGRRTITHDCLPLVADYPGGRHPAVAAKTKAFYEFDAADVLGSYLYPAMARTMRAGGSQWACQFQYDAWPLAGSNLNWQTHWLSLPYTPAKALSFAIAAEVFRRLPRGQAAPGDQFAETCVSYVKDLSELLDQRHWLHSNTTISRPPDPASLERIWGVGSNPLVGYTGTGAWFLDRLQPGCWRLEVYPDVVLCADPFDTPTVDREVARLVWCEREFQVDLPDLGAGFRVEGHNAGNLAQTTAAEGRFSVGPGVYRLLRAGAEPAPLAAGWFAPPEPKGAPVLVGHEPADAALADRPHPVRATVTDDAAVVVARYRTAGGWAEAPLAPAGPYQRAGELPPAATAGEWIEYQMVARHAGGEIAYPGGQTVAAVAPRQPTLLLDPATLADPPALSLSGSPGHSAESRLADGAVELRVTGFGTESRASSGCRLPITPLAGDETTLLIELRGLSPDTDQVELALVQADGRAFGAVVLLGQEWRTVELPIRGLRPLWGSVGTPDPSQARGLSLVFGRWLYGPASDRPHGVALRRVAAVLQAQAWRVLTEPVGPPVPLLRVAELLRQRLWKDGARLSETVGPGGRPAAALSYPGFGQPPDSLSVKATVSEASPERLAAQAGCTALRLTMRAGTDASRAVEVALTERDGSAWGTEVPLGREWQTVTVPLVSLRHFGHWRQTPGRGGPGDRCRPDQVVQLHLCIGAWLNPDAVGQPWRVELASVELVNE